MPIVAMKSKALRRFYNRARLLALKACLGGRFGEESVYILTASPRSGSTLLAQMLGAIPHSCMLFEPLHLRQVRGAARAGFSWRTYIAPDEKWPEGEAFLRRIFGGRLITEWTAKELSLREAVNSKRLIVKFVRANRLLPWICSTFDLPAPVLLLRHPCAAIASQLNYGFKDLNRPAAPSFLKDFPAFRTALSKVDGHVENLAAIWALDQLPALIEARPHPWTIVTYEDLLLSPEETLSRILDGWRLEIDMDDALQRLQIPSITVSRHGIGGMNGWKNTLSSDQVSRILRTVNAFGLSFYSHDAEPDHSLLFGQELAACIRRKGAG